MLGYSLSLLLLGLSTQLWMLFASRALSGILSSATPATAMAYVGDSTSEKERGAGPDLRDGVGRHRRAGIVQDHPGAGAFVDLGRGLCDDGGADGIRGVVNESRCSRIQAGAIDAVRCVLTGIPPLG